MKRGGVRNQEVTDAQGRRRFHGAFTGGYSAGHYNSVGSEEGWTPRTFSSSRSNRSSQILQRPEDFMDEEDDPLLGKRLETTERYDTLQTGAKRRMQQQQPDQSSAAVIPTFSLPTDWILPHNASIGVKLLKQMGWKEGHGIGQRVRRRKFEKEEEDQSKLLLQRGSEQTIKSQDDEEVYVPARKVFDVQTSFPKPKLDRYGAGFDPYRDAPEFCRYKQQLENKQKEHNGSHRHVVSFVDALKSTNGNNRATNGYGLSALEDNDDIDVYGTVSMADFDRVIAPIGFRNDVKQLESSSRYEPSKRSRALCSDGRPVLPGFELAVSNEKPLKAVNVHLTIPSNFKAYHRFNDENDEYDAVTTLYRKYQLSTDNVNKGMVVTAKQRSAILKDAIGEQDTQGDATDAAAGGSDTKSFTGSVFDLLSDEQKTKLFCAAAHTKQDSILSNVNSATTIKVPAARKDRQSFVSSSGGEQFRATISASIAKRFVSSTLNVNKEKNDFVAAKKSQGKASHRSQSLWIPQSLLCKRFHVKCAGPTGSNGKTDGHEMKLDLFDKELVPHLMEFAADRAAHRQSDDNAREVSKLTEGSTAILAADENLPPLALAEKASTELLKSIFEPSDDSLSEDNSIDESDYDGSSEQYNAVATNEPIQHRQPSRLALTIPPSARETVIAQRDRQLSAQNSSSPNDDDTSISSEIVGGNGNDKETRGMARADDLFGGEAKRRTKDERKARKKHKKHHKHRTARNEKVKRMKKDKKERKTERKTHRYHSSKH